MRDIITSFYPHEGEFTVFPCVTEVTVKGYQFLFIMTFVIG